MELENSVDNLGKTYSHIDTNINANCTMSNNNEKDANKEDNNANNNVNNSEHTHLVVCDENSTKLMDFDNVILSNDYDKVKLSINNGSTLFTNNKICNGLYNNQFGKHPKQCKDSVCYRTSLYYSLKNNCKAYITIYCLLLELWNEVPELRKLCKCCKIKTDKKYKLISNALNSVIYGMWNLKCECSDKQTFHKLYSNNYLNFQQINILLCAKMPKILKEIDKIFNFQCNPNADKFHLQEFNFCIHEDMKKVILHIEHLKDDKKFDLNNIQRIAWKLKTCYKYYEENSKICKLLFNQQTLETFKYYIDNKCTDSLLQQTIPLLYDLTYIDVDYSNDKCTSALNMCIKNGLDKSVLDFINIKANIISDDIFFSALENGYYITCFNCVEIFGIDKLMNYEKNIGYLLITESSMDITLKNNFLNKIFDMGYIPSNDMLNVAIQMPNHDVIVKTLLSKLNPSLDDAHVTIRKNKPQLLDMMLEHKLDVNMHDDYNDPLIFSCLDNIEMLNILLKHKCDINITNKNNLTPIWEASVKGEIEIIQILLEHEANFLITDDNKNSCLMIGIKNEHYIYPLIGKKNADDKYLVNYENDIGHTALILSIHAKNSLQFLQNLSQYKYINFNHVDNNGMNIIDHLIDNSKLTLDQKTKALEILLENIDFTIKPSNGKPFLVRAVENQEYEIAKYIFEYLIGSGKLELLFNDKLTKNLEKSFHFKNIKVKINMSYEIDIYTIVYNYLKQIYISGNFKTVHKYMNWYIIGTIIGVAMCSIIQINKIRTRKSSQKQKLNKN